MRSSPHTITYASLIRYTEYQVKQLEARYAGAKANGTSNLDPIVHDLECAKMLRRMLKRCEPGKQADFLELFKEVNK